MHFELLNNPHCVYSWYYWNKQLESVPKIRIFSDTAVVKNKWPGHWTLNHTILVWVLNCGVLHAGLRPDLDLMYLFDQVSVDLNKTFAGAEVCCITETEYYNLSTSNQSSICLYLLSANQCKEHKIKYACVKFKCCSWLSWSYEILCLKYFIYKGS